MTGFITFFIFAFSQQGPSSPAVFWVVSLRVLHVQTVLSRCCRTYAGRAW